MTSIQKWGCPHGTHLLKDFTSRSVDPTEPFRLTTRRRKNLVEIALSHHCIILLGTTLRMVSFKLAAILLAATADSASASLRSRRLSFQAIAGYEPGSLVTDHVSFVDHKGIYEITALPVLTSCKNLDDFIECFGP